MDILTTANVGLPTAEVRAEMERFNREYIDVIAAHSVVISGAGFRASALRGVMTALRLVARRKVEQQIAGSVEEVAEWLPAAQLELSGVAIDPAELLRALQEVQSFAKR